MRPGRRSITSDWVAALRALYTRAPAPLAVVDDPAALDLVPRGYSVTVRAANALPLGVHAAHRLLGALTLELSWGIPLRTAAIDDAVRAGAARGIGQLVVLGAGLDARAWRMPELERVVVWELDFPATQAYKRERIGALQPLAREVRFVPIDFEQQTIGGVLADAGFVSSKPSMWLWEGVTMYLTRSSIAATLDAIARQAAPGSRLAMTYITPEYAASWMRSLGDRGARLLGEELHGFIDPGDLERELSARGFERERDDAAPQWARRYWPAGDARRVRRTWERLAVATRR